MRCCGTNSSSEELPLQPFLPPAGGHQPEPVSPITPPRPFQVPELSPPPEAHILNNPRPRTSIGSPPPRYPSAPPPPPTNVEVWGTQIPPEPARGSGLRVPNPEKLIVAIDFGTTFSGVAYVSTIHTHGQVRLVLNWPESTESHRKIPTALLYNKTGFPVAWGLQAKHARLTSDDILCEWFKSYLDPVNLRSNGTPDPDLPKLPPGKDAVTVIADYLRSLYGWARTEIENDLRGLRFETEVWIMVPSKWDTKGIAMLREACFRAEIVNRYDVDAPGRDQPRVTTEAQAASLHCVAEVGPTSMKNGQHFLVCDAGGGTVDIAVHKVVGNRSADDIAEVSVQSGGKCGSLFLDLRFEQLVTTLMEHHPVHRDILSRKYFTHTFSTVEKTSFSENEDDEYFYFNCFNVEDGDAPEVGLINGSLAIPGNLLRREVFDPVINEVLELIDAQVTKCEEPLQYIFLVGGFAGNPYLLSRVQDRFADRVVGSVVRPHDADTAALRGAVMYGLQVDAGLPLISNVVAPRSYIMKVKLPAEPIDFQQRPAYISTNRAGVPVCKNRLQYLIKKGDVVEKGAKIRTRFSKLSKNAQDSMCAAVLYTSEHADMLRYSDEDGLTEICKWTVDLASLPSFMQNANVAGTSKSFYTEFEVGLELDSAEVRGVLLYNGVEWGRVVFDFLI